MKFIWVGFTLHLKEKKKGKNPVLLEEINATTKWVSETRSVLLDSYNEAILAFQGVIFLLNLKQIFVKSLYIFLAFFQNTSGNWFVINTIPYKNCIKQSFPTELICFFFLSSPKTWKHVSSVITAQGAKENGLKRK